MITQVNHKCDAFFSRAFCHQRFIHDTTFIRSRLWRGLFSRSCQTTTFSCKCHSAAITLTLDIFIHSTSSSSAIASITPTTTSSSLVDPQVRVNDTTFPRYGFFRPFYGVLDSLSLRAGWRIEGLLVFLQRHVLRQAQYKCFPPMKYFRCQAPYPTTFSL